MSIKVNSCLLIFLRYGEAESVLISELLNYSNGSTSSSGSQSAMPTASSNTNSSTNSKNKIYDDIIKEYGNEYSPYVMQILAHVYR
jgi:hypothetical protein